MDEPRRALGDHEWVKMFRAAGPMARGRDLAPLKFPLTIHRGATEARRDRMSWTVNLEKAKEHQQRHSNYGDAFIYTATVSAGAVLGYFDLRPEQEIVVDVSLAGPIGRTTP